MPDPTPPPAPKTSRLRRLPLLILSILGLLALLIAATIYLDGYNIAKDFVQSPAGQHTASAGVAKLIKVDGQFSPIHMNGWNLSIESYEGPGWPGEAIGAMNLQDMHFQLDPGALLTQWVYRIDGIQIAKGYIRLDKPDDALKRKMPPKGPRPWYAFLLPSKFVCGPMICPDTALDFPFRGGEGHLTHAHVQADLIGKNLQYTATSGTLDFAYLPQLKVDYLKMLVTRNEIEIYDLKLIGLTPADPAQLGLKARIGQHADKSIKADVDLVQMPIEQILPEELAPLIHGRATGHVIWNTDVTGKKISAEGEISLNGATIDNLSIFKQLALLHGNPDLQDFTFSDLSCKFHLEDGVFTAELVAKVPDKFSITGHIRYTLETKEADLDATFGDLPLKTWLPPEFKPRIFGAASAHLVWHGQLSTIKGSNGYVFINLDGMKVNNPVIMRRIMTRKGFTVPDELFFRTAEFNISYQDETFNLDLARLDLPGILFATMFGKLTSPGDVLDAQVYWNGLAMKNWLPEDMADQFSGDLNGDCSVHISGWKMGQGTYGGHVNLANGELRYTTAQLFAARFLDNRKLFKIPLTQASFDWHWSPSGFSAKNLDFRGGNDFGIRGGLAVDSDKQLSGTIMIGAKKTYLASFYGLADDVFVHKNDGLYWAKVKLSGTSKHPKQDLSSQLIDQLPSHPGALFALTGKMTSWYLGNVFGAEDDWLPPASFQAEEKNSKTSR